MAALPPICPFRTDFVPPFRVRDVETPRVVTGGPLAAFASVYLV